MSRLDDLIVELCPDGVEYNALSEVFNIRNGYTPSKSNREYWEGGSIPWFRMEDIRLNGGILSDSLQHITKHAVKGELFPANSIILATSATIGVHALLTVPALANQRFTFLSRKKAYVEKLDMKFFYYYCFVIDEWCLENTTLGNFLSVDMNKLKQYEIPIPPLPIQQEIVRILDNFTELTAELTAELENRKKQYAYYRDELLTFGDEVEWKTLGEITTDMYRGSGIKRDQVTEDGVQCVRYGEIYTTYNIWFDRCVSYTDEKVIQNRKYFEKGDVLFAITGESVEEIAKSCVYIGEQKCLAGGDIVVMKHEQDPKYLGYALSTSGAQMQKSKGKVKSKVVHSSVPALKAIQVPVPSIPEQKRIAGILDRFDTLVNDITIGLPAEIEARRKQYEYYRDKLLTFKPAGQADREKTS